MNFKLLFCCLHIIIVFLTLNVQAQTSESVQRSKLVRRYNETSAGNIYGFYSYKQAKWIIEPQYVEVSAFSNGKNRIAAVQNQNLEWGYINEQNEIVIPFSNRFKTAHGFNNGYATVTNEVGKWGLINRKGEQVLDFKYEYIGRYFNGVLPAKNSDNKFGYIDPTGEVIIPFLFEEAMEFVDPNASEYESEFARVVYKGSYTAINKKGQYLHFIEVNSPHLDFYKDRLVISAYDERIKDYGYAAIKADGSSVFKYSDARIELVKYYNSEEMTTYFKLSEDAMRLTDIKTTDPYDYNHFRITWKNKISPTDLIVPIISIYDIDGNEIISRKNGYNFFRGGKKLNSVGRAYAMEGKAVARYGFANWDGTEILKTLYYSTCWSDYKNVGVVGFDKVVRIGDYIDYLADMDNSYLGNAASTENAYKKERITDKHLYAVDENGNCISKKAVELDGCIELIGLLEEDYVFSCNHVPDLSFVNYDRMNANQREEIKDGPVYYDPPFEWRDLPSDKAASTEDKSVTELQINTDAAINIHVLKTLIDTKKPQKFTYTKEGLLAPGNEVDKQYIYNLFWNGRSVAFSKMGRMSPTYISLSGEARNYLSNYYSWYDDSQNARNVGMWYRYKDENTGEMVTSMTDWHNNVIIKNDSKYRFNQYLYNDLIWLKEVKNEDKNYVWNTQNMGLFPITTKNKLKNIYQSMDNSMLFPLSKDGTLYKMQLGSKDMEVLASEINRVFPFQMMNKTYLLLSEAATKKLGVMDLTGKFYLPIEYDNIQINMKSENPIIFASKNNSIFTYNLLTNESKLLREEIQTTDHFRMAFGKYGVYLKDKVYILIDVDGNEKLRIDNVENFYGQKDFSMVKKDGRWQYIDENGNNPFGRDFVDIYPFYGDLALVILDDDKNAYINHKGEFVIGPLYMTTR